jgi:hypothetical protein
MSRTACSRHGVVLDTSILVQIESNQPGIEVSGEVNEGLCGTAKCLEEVAVVDGECANSGHPLHFNALNAKGARGVEAFATLAAAAPIFW